MTTAVISSATSGGAGELAPQPGGGDEALPNHGAAAPHGTRAAEAVRSRQAEGPARRFGLATLV